MQKNLSLYVKIPQQWHTFQNVQIFTQHMNENCNILNVTVDSE